MNTAPLLRLAGAAERWVTVGELAAAGLIRRTITRACAHGDLQHAHRWRMNPEGGPKILEINLDAPTCPAHYRKAILEARRSAAEHGETHRLTERQRARAAKLSALLEEIEALVKVPSPTKERQRIEACLNGKRAADKSIPSIASYYRLRRKWRASGRQILALADGRCVTSGRVKAVFDDDAFAFFAGLYLTQDGRQASTCYGKLEEAATLHGWPIPSLATVMRTIRR